MKNSTKKISKLNVAAFRPWLFPLILVICGLIGLIASFTLTADKIHVLKDPTYSPPCNINPIFSCGSVMKSAQAEIAGIPNAMIGIVAFSIMGTIGVLMLLGARLPKRFWLFWDLGMLGGLSGVAYLFSQSVFRLHTLCIFCMTVWTVIIASAWYSLLWSIQEDIIRLPRSWQPMAAQIRRNHFGVLLLIYLAIIAFIVYKFWYFFKTL